MAKNTYKKPQNQKRKKKAASGSSKSRVSESSRARVNLIPAFLKDRRTHVIIGLFLMSFSIFTVAAIVSYFFTGKFDQSVVEAILDTSIQESGREVSNWLGVTGAILSHYLVFKWFGVSAVFIPPYLYFLGHKIIFKSEILDIEKSLYVVIFFLLWGSLLLGFLLYSSDEISELGYLSGGIGYELSVLFNSLFGWGTLIVLITSFLAFIAYFFHAYELLDAFRARSATRIRPEKRDRALPVYKGVTNMEGAEIEDIEEFPEVQEKVSGQEASEGQESKPEDFDYDRLQEVKQAVKEEVIKELELEINLGRDAVMEPKSDQQLSEQTENTKIEPVSTSQKPDQPREVRKTTKEELEIEIVQPTPADSITQVPNNPVVPPVPSTPKVNEVDLSVQKLADENTAQKQEDYDPKLDLGTYQYPTVELLIDYGDKKIQVTKDELEDNKNKIVDTLINFKIGISSIKATIGPTVTLYEIIPEAGIKISKIKNLEDDIALSLAALGIRIIAPIPGKGTIGIEVPNKKREMVDIKSVLSTEKFMKSDRALPIALGRTISNEVYVVDLAKMPHLLVAGATGQGKSVGINTIISSLLYKKHPSQLKFVLVDPKKVELTLYNKIERHFLAMLPGSDEAIITDTKKVIFTLNSLCIEMDTRYDLLKDANCRNIKEYNQKFVERRLNPEKGHRYLPYIVLVIDELADLMMTAGKEVETPIARLAQLARAIGIHLIIATQRPSVNVITGIIKANFPARLSFRVTSKVDSRTILDAGGADQLIGMGDMLLSLGSDMIRLQCAFIDTPEVERVCEYIGEQRGYSSAYQLPEFEGDGEEGSVSADVLADRDTMFNEAARLIVAHQQGSTSLIQRKLKLGYNRAGRIIDQLEAAGVVGPFEGSKAREVLVQDEYSLEQLLNGLDNG